MLLLETLQRLNQRIRLSHEQLFIISVIEFTVTDLKGM
jgi:hypothetical protein